MAKIVCQIQYYDPEILETVKLRFSTVNHVEVSASSTITTHPIINGDMIADHMFKEPIKLTIPGSFSKYGDKLLKSRYVKATPTTQAQAKDGYLVLEKPKSSYTTFDKIKTMKEIQTIFENIKNSGTLCTILKFDEDKNEYNEFLKRENMALNDVSWIESVESMSFTLNFTEALTAKITTEDVDQTDYLLPSITNLVASNFTNTLLDWSQIDEYIAGYLWDAGLMNEDFMHTLSSLFSLDVSEIISGGITIGAGAILGAAAGSIGGPVGAGIGAAVAIGVIGIKHLVETISGVLERKNYRIQAFEDYEKDKERYDEFVGSIHQTLSQLNKDFLTYRFINPGEQIAYGDINGAYYRFVFEEHLEDKSTKLSIKNKNIEIQNLRDELFPQVISYSLKVYDLNDNIIGSMTNIRTAPNTFSECSKPLFTTRNGKSVYLINYYKVGSSTNVNISNFMIVVTSTKPEDFNDLIHKYFINAVT